MIKVTVIIPVYNEDKEIARCLESLENQSLDEFEVIIVDDGSTDGTLNIVRSFRKSGYKLRILKQIHKGPGAARNFGASKAKGKILVFVDADMTFDEYFLEKLVNPILNGQSKGTFSKDETVSNWENVWARCWNINEGWAAKKRHPTDYPDKQKVFRAILKSEFDKAGGFTPGGYTDDYSLYEKLGYLAESSPGAVFYHENPSTLGQVFRHSKWVGKREYKLGIIGMLVALARASFPISLLVAFFKAFKTSEWNFIPFKIVYDFGVFWGIVEYFLWRKGAK